MASYTDDTLERIPPMLLPGEKEHVLIMQDETVFHTNEYRRRTWLAQDQQPIWKKGAGRAVHVSDFICETIGRLKLSKEQIREQAELPEQLRLPSVEARKIIYPGKGFDGWWDLPQLLQQLKSAIAIFEHTHPNCTGVFIFDRLSAHEGYADNALNVNSMNINPAGKQKKLRDTLIPLNNPDPAPGEEDTRGRTQSMCFPSDHSDPRLRGQPKGIRAVLEERKSVWDKLTSIHGSHRKLVGKCGSCTKSQVRKDAEHRVALADTMGQDDSVKVEDIDLIENATPPIADNEGWCCMHRVLALQEDFQNEKPLIQTVIEDAGHVCLFLPRFHCELNAIEMLWGYAKYRACRIHSRALHAHSSSAFQDTATLRMGGSSLQRPLSHSVLIHAVPSQFAGFSGKRGDILTLTGMCFTRVCVCARLDKTITRKGLNARQAAYANRKYASHRRVGLPTDILASLAIEDTLKSS